MEEAILANLNGSFSNMLFKVISHPGMLIYLDNNVSAGPNSKRSLNAKKQGKQAGFRVLRFWILFGTRSEIKLRLGLLQGIVRCVV